MFNSERKNPLKASEMKVLTYKMKGAKEALIANGWIQTHSIMHDGGPTGNFGVCFRKDGVSFYLNFLTIDQLPA